MDSLVTAHTSISALPLKCGSCRMSASALTLAEHDGLCRRCSERQSVIRCGACHRETKPAVLERFAGVCRGCHFNRRWPDLGRAGVQEVA
jgi:hypothetical protein